MSARAELAGIQALALAGERGDVGPEAFDEIASRLGHFALAYHGAPSAQHLERLDAVAHEVLRGNLGGFHPMSTGERLYVALATSNVGLLRGLGYTIPEALQRLDAGWADAIAERWGRYSWQDLEALAEEGARSRKMAGQEG